MLLSVMIPLYNAEKTIGNVLDSIVKQGWEKDKLEVVICDDNSTDSSLDIIKTYENKLNIVYCKTDTDFHCPGNTRYEALKHVSGEWLTSIDNDDEFIEGAFDRFYAHVLSTNEDMMVCAKFYQKYPDGSTREIVNNETWTHGKFFNMKNLVRKFNINYALNMKSHEDLYFNSQVLGHLIGHNRDYNYLDDFVYNWIYRADSLSNSFYDEKHNYIEMHLADYMKACIEPNLEMIQIYPLQVGWYFNQILMCILHAYFYYQASLARIGGDDEQIKLNKQYIANYVKICCEKLNINKLDIINYIEQIPQRYLSIKSKSFDGSNPFVEQQSFRDFILSL